VDGRVLIVLTNQREYVKGYWRKKQWELPVHAFYDIYREDTYAIVSQLSCIFSPNGIG
jgi:hypothetical protein